MNIPQNLKERFPKVKEGEPLKNHCTLRVGGSADLFYELFNVEELPELITLAEENQIPYRVIGRGTNILFTDKGYRGLLIKNLSNRIRLKDTDAATSATQMITADSGVLLAQLVRISVENDLRGIEPLYGLPGTIGAAIWGNAGIPGTELNMFLKKVTIFNVADGIREVDQSEIEFRYRGSSLQQGRDIVLWADFEFPRGKKEESKELMKQIDIIRRGKQPIGYSAGSFFKNPTTRPSDREAPLSGRPNKLMSRASETSIGTTTEKAAGYLIDQVGLKGFCVGDAQISEKHGNFFMNKGNATYAQILELAQVAQAKVKERFGIDLEMEVKIVGEK